MQDYKKKYKQGYQNKWKINEEKYTYRYLQSYGRPLDMVTTFIYLGWVLTKSDNNWLVVVANIQKARNKWTRLSMILG